MFERVGILATVEGSWFRLGGHSFEIPLCDIFSFFFKKRGPHRSKFRYVTCFFIFFFFFCGNFFSHEDKSFTKNSCCCCCCFVLFCFVLFCFFYHSLATVPLQICFISPDYLIVGLLQVASHSFTHSQVTSQPLSYAPHSFSPTPMLSLNLVPCCFDEWFP